MEVHVVFFHIVSIGLLGIAGLAHFVTYCTHDYTNTVFKGASSVDSSELNFPVVILKLLATGFAYPRARDFCFLASLHGCVNTAERVKFVVDRPLQGN